MTCLDDQTLAELALGRLEEGSGLLAHVSACGRCRGVLAALLAWRPEERGGVSSRAGAAFLSAVPPSRPRARWMPFAAAAALLLGIGVYGSRQGGRPEAVPTPSSGSASRSDPPFAPCPVNGTLEAKGEDLAFLVGQATSVTLRAGSQAERIGAAGLRVLRGSAWIEDPGEPFEVQAAGGLVRITQGDLLVEMDEPARAAAWLREAHAEDGPQARVVVTRGSAEVRLPGSAPVLLGAGQALRVRPSGLEGPVEAPPPAWRGEEGWQRPQDLPLRLREGAWALAPRGLPESCAWELVLKRPAPGVALAVVLGAEGRRWSLPLGAPLHQAGQRLRVRVEQRRGWVRVQAGPWEVLRARAADLGERLERVDEAPGLRVWGGDLEVLESRWKEISS